MMLKFRVFLLLLLAAPGAVVAGESLPGGQVLDRFMGRWHGTATAYFPRRPERETRDETVEVNCERALKETYVECHSKWTDQAGVMRELRMFWNYHPRDGRFEILYLYDNWPGKVQYLLDYDPEKRSLTGRDSFEGPGGVSAEEIVSWQFAADGQTIRSTEQNHFATDAGDYWPVMFEFTWQRSTD